MNPNFIERHFGELKWTKPEQNPSISLARAFEDRLKVRLGANSTAERPEFVAIWRKPEGHVEVLGKTLRGFATLSSGPLEIKEQALELLMAYAKGDVSYQTAVEWAPVEKE